MCRGAVICVVACVVACSDAPSFLVEVDPDHRFHIGDDPRFAASDFDDTSWETRELPAVWRHRTIDVDVVGWHRFRLGLAKPPPGQLALDVGAIGWSDEVFINGRRIGGTGEFGRLPQLGQWPRLYSIPDGLLHEGTNVVAIRVGGVPLGISGLFADRIGIGSELELARTHERFLSRTKFIEGMLFGFLVVSWLLVAFFPKRGRPGRATLFLLAAITFAFVMLWLLSVTLRDTGWSPDVSANVLVAVLTLAGITYWGFVATIVRGAIPRILRVLIGIESVIAVLMLTLPRAFPFLVPAATVTGLIAFIVLCRMFVGAIRARVPGGIPIAIGCVLAALGIAAMWHAPQPFIVGLPAAFLGTAAAIAFAVLALTRHVHDFNRQMQRATEYSLEAHTRERGRLARDLHDGIGQMLALLKMQMQRMSRKHDGEPVQRAFDESAEHVATTLDELRRISRDLRPAPLEDRTFAEAVREYAAAMARRSGLDVEVEGSYTTTPSERIGDELYRIAQECLTNCLKHSGARRIVVTFAEIDDRYSLKVTDDGRGLPAEISSGLGLATIRERSELLGGSCTISASADGGTSVEVRVPRS